MEVDYKVFFTIMDYFVAIICCRPCYELLRYQHLNFSVSSTIARDLYDMSALWTC